MKASSELLFVTCGMAGFVGVVDLAMGHGWKDGLLIGGAAGLVIFLVRFVDGETVSSLPQDERLDEIERRLDALEEREP